MPDLRELRRSRSSWPEFSLDALLIAPVKLSHFEQVPFFDGIHCCKVDQRVF